ncbi:MAG: tRNA (adenosine(37)-N6)-dimethylallyltransferase MiaA [Anaerolineales bacterium]
MARPPLIVIVGPTAVGKTELGIQLAERLDGEIVSADSRLFYRGMDIGTAKPSAAEMARARHHLIDVADPDENWSLSVFQAAAREAIDDTHRRGKLPFLVGGTGQYVRAVTEGWTPPEVIPNPQLRSALEALAQEYGPYWLHDKLRVIDPAAAEKIDARNVRRTVRALEVIFITGRRFSAQGGVSDSPYRLTSVGLMRPRPELYARVDQRIESMFANGLLNEVQTLLDKGYSPTLPTLSAIGYRECVAVLQGAITLDEAKTQIKKMTRIFVRRQGNWFKENDPQIAWFEMGAGTAAEVETYLRKTLIEGG